MNIQKIGNQSFLNEFNLRQNDTLNYLFKVKGENEEIGKISVK